MLAALDLAMPAALLAPCGRDVPLYSTGMAALLQAKIQEVKWYANEQQRHQRWTAIECWFACRQIKPSQQRISEASKLFKQLNPSCTIKQVARHIQYWRAHLWRRGTLSNTPAPAPPVSCQMKPPKKLWRYCTKAMSARAGGLLSPPLRSHSPFASIASHPGPVPGAAGDPSAAHEGGASRGAAAASACEAAAHP